jgi:D-3-phosphoglycerate dehydrogenase / 2-oxoglutarate reductase
MPTVLISENISGAPVAELQKNHEVSLQPELWKDCHGLLAAVRSARALIVRNQTQVTAELIAAAENLQIIARAGVGLDNVDVRAASQAGVVVAFTPSQNAVSVAELTLGLMLALARKIAAADRHVKQGGWARYQFMGSELYGKTLGVVGLGRIGCLTARRAAAFGMEVAAYDPYVDPDSLLVAELRPRLLGLDELLATADVVTCHMPHTPQTRGMFDYARFCRMKPSAMFVNVARGEVVDEAGLVRALEEHRIAGAGLDVRQKEPPAPGPLCAMENVILTPHIGAFTDEGQYRVVASVCRDVAAVLAGQGATNYVNFAKPQRQARVGD